MSSIPVNLFSVFFARSRQMDMDFLGKGIALTYFISLEVTSIGTMMVEPVVGKCLDYTHHVYRYTYLATFILTVLALLAGLVLHSKFMRLGDPKAHVAPE